MFRRAIRLILFFAVSVMAALTIRGSAWAVPRPRRYRHRLALQRLWGRAACRIVGIHVEVQGESPAGGGFLIASNHLGYLDIPVLSGVMPATFVSKSDVSDWPLFGFLARTAGTIFVDREDRGKAADFIGRIKVRLAEGENVYLFPEGTSSRGETVLPFKSAPFASVAGIRECAVLPVRIDLLAVGGKTARGSIRDIVCWHGGMEFVPHFWNFLGSRGADFRVRIGEPLRPEDLDRKTLSRIARARIIELGDLRSPRE